MNKFKHVLATPACIMLVQVIMIIMMMNGEVKAQDDLAVEAYYDLSSHFFNHESFLQGVLRDNDTAYVFTQLAPELFVFNISDFNINTVQGDLQSKFKYPCLLLITLL